MKVAVLQHPKIAKNPKPAPQPTVYAPSLPKGVSSVATKQNNYKIIAVNLNGIRAALPKGFENFVIMQKPDILCVSETKIGAAKIGEFVHSKEYKNSVLYSNYNSVFASSTQRQGYSGVAVFIRNGIIPHNYHTSSTAVSNDNIINTEGRFIQVEFEQFILISVYVPNSGRGEEGFINERRQYEKDIMKIIESCKKPVIYCGDLNVVAEKIDIWEWNRNVGSPGMTPEEQEDHRFLKQRLQFKDAFREKHPDERKYTWFSNFGMARANAQGWRLDYFLVSQSIFSAVKDSLILDEFRDFSDHVPITLSLDFK